MTALVWQGTARAPSYYTCNLFWPVAKLVSLRTLRFWARWKVFVPQTRSSASCLLGHRPLHLDWAPRQLRVLPQNNLPAFNILLELFLFGHRWMGGITYE